mgnify:CR=1 FL=1
MQTNQIIILDADDISRNGMETLLKKSELNADVVGTFSALRPCKKFLQSHIADVLLFHDSIAEPPHILKQVSDIHQRHNSLAIVMVSTHLSVDYIQALFKIGTMAFIYRKDHFASQLIHAIEAIGRGDWYLSSQASRLLYTGISLTPPRLSRRDMDVARLMRDGCTVQEIAVALDISDHAVYRSRRKLRENLHVQNSDQIIAAAIEKGLL